MKRRLLISLMVACLTLLTACGAMTAEDLIRADLTSQLDELKEADDDIIAEFVAGLGDAEDEFEALGVDPSEFMTAYLDGFDYSIDEVDVEESTAEATVTVTCKSLADIMENAADEYLDRLDEVDLTSDTSEEQLYQLMGEIMMEAAETAELTSTECTFTYTCDDEGVWTADDGVEDALLAALLA